MLIVDNVLDNGCWNCALVDKTIDVTIDVHHPFEPQVQIVFRAIPVSFLFLFLFHMRFYRNLFIFTDRWIGHISWFEKKKK